MIALAVGFRGERECSMNRRVLPRLRERDGVRDRCHWPYAKLVSGANGPDSTMTSRIVPL